MPNAVHTKVDASQLGMAAGNIDCSLRCLWQALNAVSEELRGILRPTWQGSACDHFFSQYDADEELFRSQLESLSKLNNLLMEAAAVYDDADAKALEEIRKLGGRYERA